MIHTFNQGVNKLPGFVDARYVVGISYTFDDNGNKAHIHLIGGGEMVLYISSTSTDAIKEICESIQNDVTQNNTLKILPGK